MDFLKLREFLKAKNQDAVVLVGEFKNKGKVANALIKRIAQILIGIEEETRSADANATTKYTRPLPGAARLYPETDIRPVEIEKNMIAEVKKELPEPWTKKLSGFKRKLKLSDDLAKQILYSKHLNLFENIVKKKKSEASVIANMFVNTLKDLEKREKVNVNKLTDKHFVELFDYLAKKKIVKEAIPEILKYLAKNPNMNVSAAIKELNLTAISSRELEKIIEDVIKNRPDLNRDKIIGIVMSKVRGRIEAQVVIETVKKTMKH